MNLPRFYFALIFVICARVSLAQESPQSDTLQLTLPPEIYAVQGVETNVFFDNIVLTQTPEEYRFQVTPEFGQTDPQRWTFRPDKNRVGVHNLTFTVSTRSGKVVASKETRLRVIPPDAGQGRKIRLLIVGDSLTHASFYPNEIHRLLSLPENPESKMLGTHQPARAKPEVAHEGYGGWTWERFATKYEPNPDGTYRKRSSPFVYLEKDAQPKLDAARYIREECDTLPPDFVIFMLGINDCFSAPADNVAGIDKRIDAMLQHAETLLTEFHKVAPHAELGICLTTPPNSRQAAFEANYKDRYPRWGWKRIQHRLVQRQIAYFGNQQSQNRFLIPTQLNLDPIAGYPDNNAVHPNEAGYQQIGQSIYAWLKWRLSEAAPSK